MDNDSLLAMLIIGLFGVLSVWFWGLDWAASEASWAGMTAGVLVGMAIGLVVAPIVILGLKSFVGFIEWTGDE